MTGRPNSLTTCAEGCFERRNLKLIGESIDSSRRYRALRVARPKRVAKGKAEEVRRFLRFSMLMKVTAYLTTPAGHTNPLAQIRKTCCNYVWRLFQQVLKCGYGRITTSDCVDQYRTKYAQEESNPQPSDP